MKIFNYREIVPQLYNIIIRRRFKFTFELIPYEVRGLSYRKIGNFFKAGMNQFILPSKPLGYPVIAQIEPVNFCNLSCPLCLTTSETSSRPGSILRFEEFKKFIDDAGDYLLLIILWNWGEPFLNPDIFRMISYAKSKNIIMHSSTNGNVKFDEEKAEKLVDSGLDSLVIAVDGASQDTYSKYRKGGNLDQVLENIKTIVRVKKIKRSETPRLIMRSVVMQHNEAELPLMRRLAEELEVDYFTLKTVDMPPSIGQDLDKDYAPKSNRYRRYEYKDGSYQRKQKPFMCMRPWKRITLDALGEIIPCEYEYKDLHTFGSIQNGRSAVSAWKGKVAQEFRKKFNLGNNDYYLCKDCTYKDRIADDCIVEKFSLKMVQVNDEKQRITPAGNQGE